MKSIRFFLPLQMRTLFLCLLIVICSAQRELEYRSLESQPCLNSQAQGYFAYGYQVDSNGQITILANSGDISSSINPTYTPKGTSYAWVIFDDRVITSQQGINPSCESDSLPDLGSDVGNHLIAGISGFDMYAYFDDSESFRACNMIYDADTNTFIPDPETSQIRNFQSCNMVIVTPTYAQRITGGESLDSQFWGVVGLYGSNLVGADPPAALSRRPPPRPLGQPTITIQEGSVITTYRPCRSPALSESPEYCYTAGGVSSNRVYYGGIFYRDTCYCFSDNRPIGSSIGSSLQ